MATGQNSPGVVFQERDLTTTSTVPSANVGVLVAPFAQGPVDEVVEITSERDLVERFGEPNEYNYEYWYTAAQFLSYGGLLKAIRVSNTALKNAVNGGTAPLIKNRDDYEANIEGAANSFDWVSREPGTLNNSIGIFVTDAGADQILVLPAPGSGNEHEFVADAALSAASGAGGEVFKYSIVLTVESIVGSFTPGSTTTVAISGSNETVNVLAYDAANKKLEIGLPSGGVTGIIAAGQTITQGTNTCDIATSGVERRLYVALTKDSIAFKATDVVADTNATNVTVSAVRDEYNEREYLPGLKWVNVASRPGTSSYAADKGGHRDELHVLVIDIDGNISGTPGQLLERYVGLSKASDAKTTVGEVNYYPTVIKQKSQYVYWAEHETEVYEATSTASDGNFGQTADSRQFNLLRSAAGSTAYPSGATTIGSKNNATHYYRLASGADYPVSGGFYNIGNADVSTSYDLVLDAEAQIIDFILTGPSGADDSSAVAKITNLVTIAESRRDCMVFASPRRGNVIGETNPTTITNNIVAFMDQLPSSSYLVLDSGYKYIYDKYNDVYRYIPTNGDVAGLCLQTAVNADPWFSPAGFTRGVLNNAVKLAYTPNKSQRDTLYSARVNPIVSFPGQGIVLYGDKTALGFASAFDRINVRRLFLTIERFIGAAAKTQLFEQNDEEQRTFFRNIVEPYLRDVQGRRGITDFLVKCDAANNPPEAVDRGEFQADIFVKPTRTINYITLNFVATRSGVAFNEVAN
tara:strand:+ start:1085 stop:3337 length:2253 start_codon:yes stop_codon:yes gene_type:complete